MRFLALASAVLVATIAAYSLISNEDQSSSDRRVTGVRPCDVPIELLRRVWRGYMPGRSGDVLLIEWAPNQFAGLRHSTPFPYTQNVPLVLYGPGFIKQGASFDQPVTVADMAPTMAELLHFDEFPEREGRMLHEALVPEEQRREVPRLIFTLVWDGGGDNLLEQWPQAWPNLKDLMSKSAVFENATVGSSPSITPAVHSTIGTGVFPRVHGQTDMFVRIGNEMRFIWEKVSPKFLETPTLADLWDVSQDNEPIVGAMARSSYHLGMMGHGAFLEGGDRDITVVDETNGLNFNTNERYYELPSYIRLRQSDLAAAVRRVDGLDGSVDGEWLGNPISAEDSEVRNTPAWPIYQTKILVDLMEREGFGQDDVADLLFVNYKSTDLAGHAWNLLEPEEEGVLEEQDRQLGVLIDALDDLVGEGRYVLSLTADHGISPYPSRTGGWAVSGDEIIADIDRELGRQGSSRSLVVQNRGYQMFLDPKEMRASNVTAADISEFLRDYRISENVTSDEGLRGFEGRSNERIFLTALTPSELEDALACAARKQ
ncbi:MAG: alkaline phosphatase family protein [Actinomycetota bacterium]|nr:alkaline phosphatase family protein [Actinomycetota bacterium]